MRKIGVLAAATTAAVALTACGSGTAGGGQSTGDTSAEDVRLVNVVKLVGVGWFDRMEVGVKEFAQEEGVDATQTGGDDASPEKQVKIVQDLIAQKPTAITVVPNSPESLEGAFKRARDQGIIVVTHEASNQQNIDADIEAFDNTAYGSLIMDNLAECMGGSGEYVAFVGNLTAKTHMEWVQGALDKAKSSYAGVTRVTDPIESKEDEGVAYQKTKEILAKYPNIKGFQGSASTDVVGIARAIQEAGLEDKICVMGTSIPSVSAKYLDSGAIDKIFFWDPAVAGKAMLKIAQMLAEDKTIQEGVDLGYKGYESLKASKDNPKVFYGDAWIVVDKTNVAQYDF